MCSQTDHDRRKRPSQWPTLHLVGIQCDLRGRPMLEMRDCPECWSTLAIELPLEVAQ